MRFFRRQQQARRRSTRLVALYALALAGTVVLTAAVLGSLPLIFGFGSPRHSLWWYYLPPAILVCLLTIGLSLHRLRELRLGGEAVAKRLGGEQLQLQEASFAERRLLNVVAETALAAGLPTPPVYLLRRDGSINAFAAGLSRRRAVIGVTQGAVHRLKRDELQAVIAHEFSHILHGDMRLNLRLSAWLHGLQGIASSGRYFLEGRDDEHYLEYRRNKNVDNHPFDNGIEIIMQTLPLQVFGILMIALGSIGSLFAGWLQAAVCRQREFLADASAVQFTRQTAPLIEALRKIARSGSCRLRSAQGPEYAHMMFGRITSGSLAATHPPIIERIRRLDPLPPAASPPSSKAPTAPSTSPKILPLAPPPKPTPLPTKAKPSTATAKPPCRHASAATAPPPRTCRSTPTGRPPPSTANTPPPPCSAYSKSTGYLKAPPSTQCKHSATAFCAAQPSQATPSPSPPSSGNSSPACGNTPCCPALSCSNTSCPPS